MLFHSVWFSTLRDCLILVILVALLGLLLPVLSGAWLWLAVGMAIGGGSVAVRDAVSQRRIEQPSPQLRRKRPACRLWVLVIPP